MYAPIKDWSKRESFIDPNGYVRVFVPEHPKSFKGGWYYEHRLVAEKLVGRILESYETAHHINEIKHDNDPKNIFPCYRYIHDKAHVLTGQIN